MNPIRAITSISLTRKLAVVTAAAAPVWLLSGFTPGLVVALLTTGAVVLAAVVDLVLTPSTAEISVKREMPAASGIGDEGSGSYTIDSRWPRAAQVEIFDSFPRVMGRENKPLPPVTIGARETATAPFRFTPLQRGRHEHGPVALRVTGPLGLVRRTLRYTPSDSTLVTPSLSGVRRYRLLAIQHRLRDAGVRSVRKRGQGTSFANLRDYAVGDDPRHIDWKGTARRNRVITREFTVEQGQTILIAVDAGRMMTQLAGNLPRFEHSLSAALVLADVAIHSRDEVGLIVFDDAIRAFVPPARGKGALESIRNALVTARASLVEPDYAMAFRTIETRHRKRSMIVMFTDVIDVRSSQTLLAHTARSAMRHLPLVVALRNDQLMQAAEPTKSEDSATLFRTAAAEELVLEREAALMRMRRTGVSVLDVSPLSMSAAVVNRYLELKARSSL